jgi:hypothetical protein
MKDLCASFSRMVLLIVVCAAIIGCGGGASTSPATITPPPTASTASFQGQWQLVAHSNVNPAGSVVVEANFSQTGSAITADKSNVVLIGGAPGAFTSLSGECDNGVLGDDSVTATISGQTVSFTLTEAGSLGTGTSTGSGTLSGSQITSGTYDTPAACGFAADSGTLTGTTIPPFSGTFAGQLANSTGSTDAVVVTVSQSGYSLDAVGTDAGAPISLTGKVIGATFHVTGVVQGQSREYFGIHDTTSNILRVYDRSFNPLGSLAPQSSAPPPTPITVSISPTTSSLAPNATQTFMANVSNDGGNRGVTWSLSCATANNCGSLSTMTSASGAAITYTAPATVPQRTIALTATSVSDSTKSASATITITADASITVSLSPTSATMGIGGATQTFTAMVQNDSQNKGVTWTVSGANCSGAACGTVSPPSSASGESVTYSSPASGGGTVMLTATSVSDSNASATATITLTTPSPKTPTKLGAGSYPSAAVDVNGIINVAWFTEAGIAFARSQNQGATFSAPTIAVPAPAFEPSIGVDGQGDIFILTGNNPTNALGGAVAVVAHSTDAGKTFKAVTAQQNTFDSLLLVQPSGVVDLAYTTSDDNGEDPDNALHEIRSTDGGNTFTHDQTLWTAPINGSDIAQIRGALGPQGQIYYTWTEQVDLNCEVNFVNSLDGDTFRPSVLLTNNDDCNRNGALVVDSVGNINATWATGNTNFVRSTDQGQTFITPTHVPIGDQAGQLAVSPNGALNSVIDGQPLTFTQSMDNGLTWSAPVSLGLPAPPADFMGPQDAQIAVDPDGKITVVWRDDSNGTFAGDFDVYISTSTDGKNFTPATNISNTTGTFASAPTVLISPQGLRYIYWYETSNTNPADVNVFFYSVQ